VQTQTKQQPAHQKLSLSPAMADTAGAPPTQNGSSLLETTKANATAAYNSVTSGPVAQNVMHETNKTTDELYNLAAARKTPANSAATGQPLTHYHSFFSELLSWNNPRASAIAYAGIVSFIFAARYLNLIPYAFKLTYLTIGITVAAEAAGKLVLNNGLASQMRPRQYYTIPRQTLDSLIGDVHELINFFVIEAQRILFAENIAASAIAGFSAFLSYFLIRIVPFWGLAVIATTAVFFVPLVYTTNQELIDHHLKNASDAINAQSEQVRNVAGKQAEQFSAISKQYAGDYTAKVQEMLGSRTASPPAKEPQFTAPPAKEPQFPAPPTEEPRRTAAETATPVDVPEDPIAPSEDNPSVIPAS
jgi:hypothetical protein